MTKIEAYQQKREELKVLLRELLNMGHDAIQHAEALENKLMKYEEAEARKQIEEEKVYHVGDEVVSKEGHRLLVLNVIGGELLTVYDSYYKTAYTLNCITDGKPNRTGRYFTDLQNIIRDVELENLPF